MEPVEAQILLQGRSVHQGPHDPVPSFKLFDIVIVNDDKIPKLLRTLGRLTRLIPERYTITRVCKPLTGDVENLTLPVQGLYLLGACTDTPPAARENVATQAAAVEQARGTENADREIETQL